MKYLVLIFSRTGVAGSAADLGELLALQDELTGTGEFVSAEGLGVPTDGRIVRARDGATTVTGGPLDETADQLAGFLMIDCDGDDRADEIAARVSAAVGDRVEIRGVTRSA
jgi:hypothetical protein